MKCGIIGLPNVGKSTLFSVLTKQQAKIGDYPFCTIEPNQARLLVKDKRLEQLAKLENSAQIIPAYIDVIDIAGLVKGAYKGEGMGNQFLSHIRNVDMLIHVLDNFRNQSSLIEDMQIIQMELALADINFLEKKLTKKDSTPEERDIYQKALLVLNKEKMLHGFDWDDQERHYLQSLITMKPMLYVCNGENSANLSFPHLLFSAQTAFEVDLFTKEEKELFTEEVQKVEREIDDLIQECYALLYLQTFFTSGRKETRAWSFISGTKAPQAAGIIHSDFERLFIRAEIAKFQDMIQCQGWKNAKLKGKCRLEGKSYTIQDGDVVYFHVSN